MYFCIYVVFTPTQPKMRSVTNFTSNQDGSKSQKNKTFTAMRLMLKVQTMEKPYRTKTTCISICATDKLLGMMYERWCRSKNWSPRTRNHIPVFIAEYLATNDPKGLSYSTGRSANVIHTTSTLQTQRSNRDSLKQ